MNEVISHFFTLRKSRQRTSVKYKGSTWSASETKLANPESDKWGLSSVSNNILADFKFLWTTDGEQTSCKYLKSLYQHPGRNEICTLHTEIQKTSTGSWSVPEKQGRHTYIHIDMQVFIHTRTYINLYSLRPKLIVHYERTCIFLLKK